MHEALARENFDRDAKFLSPRFVASRNWKIHTVEFPIIDVTFTGTRPLRVRLTCDDWDELAPSAALLEPDGKGPAQGLPGGMFHPSGGPGTNLPFVCMRGIREYHSHSSHLTDYWETYKNQDGMNLPGLLNQISAAWRKVAGL